MATNNLDIQSLHSLIERYFDGETSVAEERQLRDELARTSYESEAISEAKAVMSFFAAKRNKDKRTNTDRSKLYLRVAATIAVIIASVFATNILIDKPTDSSYSYIAGTYTNNSDRSIEIIKSQLSEISIAQASIYNDISADFDCISEAINNTNL